MSHKVFLDTNIILDLLGKRDEFYEPIAKLATIAEKKKIAFYASPISFATAHYFLSKYENQKIATEHIRKFKIICRIAIVNESIVEKALNSNFKDFEDALQHYSAILANCDILLTRNIRDFKKSEIPVMTADEFLKSLK